MAFVEKNGLINALSGKVGNLVFKQYSFGTVLSSAPDRSKVKLSTKQKNANSNFKAAVAYAKAVLADPEKRKAYEVNLKPGQSVYHLALAEYLKTR